MGLKDSVTHGTAVFESEASTCECESPRRKHLESARSVNGAITPLDEMRFADQDVG